MARDPDMIWLTLVLAPQVTGSTESELARRPYVLLACDAGLIKTY